ncbi:nucleoside transporter family protein [Cryptosporidium muris RN66]|uniref:Nucleoside transporter family protein n=1 Tax=Cryptosporidium muris (strain RN66) TaxID=441375 RepID=B6AE91_CRYMR|nr:nucleoside transporter family protein [Cryptosporidium muris RN66]EEA06532.1 nucleoside transporter family protein [Cryptosporidium muris RN66]|eukprot:XP_002140881.1 nucleoside transporter family protein [Cryptosporidium muris RN66]
MRNKVRRGSELLVNSENPFIGHIIPKNERIYGKIMFNIFGIASLFTWNVYLSCCGILNRDLFPNMGFMQYIQTSYMTSVLVGNLTMVMGLTHLFDPHRCTVMLNCMGAIQSTIVAISIWLLFGSFSGCLINIVVTALVAFSCAILIPETFTLASIMPENFCLDVSFGQGLSGVITFALTFILDMLLPSTILGRRILVTTLFIMSTIISLTAAGLAQTLTKLPWCYSVIAEMRRSSIYSLESSLPRTSRISYAESVMSVPISIESEYNVEYSTFKVSTLIWQQLYNIFMTFLVTLTVFPTICTQWEAFNIPERYSNLFTILLVGIFHLGDILGRYLPRFGIFIPPSFLWVLTTARLAFIPLYAHLKTAPATNIIGSIWFKFLTQFLLALTNGCCAYLAFIYGPDAVYQRQNKEKASFLLAIYNVAGMTAGSWLMNLLIWIGFFQLN